MPNTGSDHNPGCDRYEPPAELSGLGEVMGAAIHEDPDQNVTALKLAFSLSKQRSEEHTSELQSLMRLSYAVFRFTYNISYHLRVYPLSASYPFSGPNSLLPSS